MNMVKKAPSGGGFQTKEKEMYTCRGKHKLVLLYGDSFQRSQHAGIVGARFQQT